MVDVGCKSLKGINLCCWVMYLPWVVPLILPNFWAVLSSSNITHPLPCLICYICHIFTNIERQQDVTMCSSPFAQDKARGWYGLDFSCRKVCKAGFSFSASCPLHGQVPTLCIAFFPLSPVEAEICSPSLPLHKGVLAASVEMWSKFLLSNAKFYAIYDSLYGQILWIDSPLLCDCTSYSSILFA